MTAAVSFGIIIGYLAWHAFNPDQRTVSIRKMGALIAVIGGASILSLFPIGSAEFNGYAIGLVIGFFSRNIFKSFSKFLINPHHDPPVTQVLSTEKFDILLHWGVIENVINDKLRFSRKLSKNDVFTTFVSVDDLDELPYSQAGKIYCMRKFSREHSDSVELQVDDHDIILIKRQPPFS